MYGERKNSHITILVSGINEQYYWVEDWKIKIWVMNTIT